MVFGVLLVPFYSSYDDDLREVTGQAPQVVSDSWNHNLISCFGDQSLSSVWNTWLTCCLGSRSLCDSVHQGKIAWLLLLCNKPEGVNHFILLMDPVGCSGWAQCDGCHSSVMFGAFPGKMPVLGLLSSRTPSLPCLATTRLGQGPQVGQWPEHLHVASQRGFLHVC